MAIITATDGRTYAQMSAGVVIRIFTILDMDSWDDTMADVADITDLTPLPDYGDTWDGANFTPLVLRPPVEDRKRYALWLACDKFVADPTVNPAAKTLITAIKKFFS